MNKLNLALGLALALSTIGVSLGIALAQSATNQAGTGSANSNNTSTTANSTTSASNTMGTTTAASSSSFVAIGGIGTLISLANTGTTAAETTNSSTVSSNATSSSSSLISGSSSANATNISGTTSAVPRLPYTLVGTWSMTVNNGMPSSFLAIFTMVHTDGSDRHTHTITNFVPDSNAAPMTLNPNGNTTISGKADVSLNGTLKWSGIHTVITIGKMNSISIALDSAATNNHFGGQLIYGVVNSIQQTSGTSQSATTGTSSSSSIPAKNAATTNSTAANSTTSSMGR